METTQLSVIDLAIELIKKRQEAKTLAEETKAIEAELLQRDFEKEEIEGITVSRKTRRTISLLPDVDKAAIKDRYPELVQVKNVLDMKKVDDELLAFIEEKSPEAIVQEYDVNEKLLHECCKDYTTQKVTTYLEVK